jgi:DNA-directed RNA polymerase sigma subunit (sigma70/sigma32)
VGLDETMIDDNSLYFSNNFMTRECFSQALNCLESRYGNYGIRLREVIERRYFREDNESQAEIAEDWGVSRQTVNALEKRALERVKIILLKKFGLVPEDFGF